MSIWMILVLTGGVPLMGYCIYGVIKDVSPKFPVIVILSILFIAGYAGVKIEQARNRTECKCTCK